MVDKTINSKIDEHLSDFKKGIFKLAAELGISHDKKVDELLKYVHTYKSLVFPPEDFVAKKRAKPNIELAKRCLAKCSNNLQCTRSKFGTADYCKPHLNSQPFGIITNIVGGTEIQINTQYDSNGILQFVDKDGNCYSHEDIATHKSPPAIIGHVALDNAYK